MLKWLFALAVSIAVLPSSAAEPDCNRQCLINLADAYVQALIAHDLAQVPLSDSLKTVENLQPITRGDGLWKSAAGVSETFRIVVPDAVSQQIGFMVVMQEQRAEGGVQPIQVAFRLQLEAGKIVEAEHLINRELDAVSLGHLQSPRLPLVTAVPMPYRDARNRLLTIGASYYEALVLSNGALAPFGDDCVRHENGHQTSRNAIPADPLNDFAVFASMGCAAQLNSQIYAYIDSIDFRRVEIADEETGLVFGLSHFRQAMSKGVYKTPGVPGYEEFTDNRASYDLAAVHIFKIWGGQIHEVEAVGLFADYMTTTGWE